MVSLPNHILRRAQDERYKLMSFDGLRTSAQGSVAVRGRWLHEVLGLAVLERGLDRLHQFAGRLRRQLDGNAGAWSLLLVDEVDQQSMIQRRVNRVVVANVRLIE